MGLRQSGFSDRIALIDTENGSASLYADKFEFDTLTLEPPYTISKYINAVNAAVIEGYGILVIDSITHAWAGDGGLLEKKEALDQRGGNSFSNWSSITKEHEKFKAMLLSSPVHLICTMRSKQDYVLEMNGKGKSAPKKVGLAPIQRDGMEYEFTAVFDVAMDHNCQVSKDRTGLFDGEIFKLSEKTGAKIADWVEEGGEVEPTPGDYVMCVGKFKGQTLRSVGKKVVAGYKLFLLDQAKTAKREIPKEFQDMMTKIDEFVN